MYDLGDSYCIIIPLCIADAVKHELRDFKDWWKFSTYIPVPEIELTVIQSTSPVGVPAIHSLKVIHTWLTKNKIAHNVYSNVADESSLSFYRFKDGEAITTVRDSIQDDRVLFTEKDIQEAQRTAFILNMKPVGI